MELCRIMRLVRQSLEMARKKEISLPLKPGKILKKPEYSAFASIYDACMTHVPMRSWARRLLSEAGERSAIADLGCGTGHLLQEILSVRRLRAFGVDRSPEMLERARRRLGSRADLREGDLRATGLPDGCVDWVVSTHDSVNYLKSEQELFGHFKEVLRILGPNGLYSFDATTESNLTREFDGQVREEMIGDIYLHWSNHYDRNRQVLVSTLAFQDGRGMASEIHEQRFYSREAVESLLLRAGFETVRVEGDYEERPPEKGDAFMNFHCRTGA